MTEKDLLSISDLAPEEVGLILRRAVQMKSGERSRALEGMSVALLFEKPSLRTRASFSVAVHQLGGHSFYMGKEEVGLGVRESIADVARVLSRYVDCIVARVFSHAHLEELAEHADVPVINALSDREHPCQALADILTILEHKGRLEGVNIAYVGDGNNVALSLCLAAVAAGANFTGASPPGYGLKDPISGLTKDFSENSKGRVRLLRDPQEAVAGADVVYTDVWTSMGQEEEAEQRRRDFEPYRVDEKLFGHARSDAILMHDMPAHYGEEVPPGMLDHPRSVVFDQAENRLHAQKAVLEFLMERSKATHGSSSRRHSRTP